MNFASIVEQAHMAVTAAQPAAKRPRIALPPPPAKSTTRKFAGFNKAVCAAVCAITSRASSAPAPATTGFVRTTKHLLLATDIVSPDPDWTAPMTKSMRSLCARHNRDCTAMFARLDRLPAVNTALREALRTGYRMFQAGEESPRGLLDALVAGSLSFETSNKAAYVACLAAAGPYAVIYAYTKICKDQDIAVGAETLALTDIYDADPYKWIGQDIVTSNLRLTVPISTLVAVRAAIVETVGAAATATVLWAELTQLAAAPSPDESARDE
jgi:hypothetical protein